jgi:hypothetical protein
LLLIVLKDCFEFYKIICFGLIGFETILKNFQKKRETRKRKNKRIKEQKKKKATGRPFGPARETAHDPPGTPNRIGTLLSFLSLTSGAHSSDSSSSLGQTPPPAWRSPLAVHHASPRQTVTLSPNQAGYKSPAIPCPISLLFPAPSSPLGHRDFSSEPADADGVRRRF